MNFRRVLIGVLMLAATPMVALAQSANTAAIVVTVVDQNGAVVLDATVTVRNQATGAARDLASQADGSATFSALGLTGAYTVSVRKAGFTADDVKNLTLRSAETATVRITLVATGGHSDVTVYGTTEGVRADP